MRSAAATRRSSRAITIRLCMRRASPCLRRGSPPRSSRLVQRDVHRCVWLTVVENGSDVDRHLLLVGCRASQSDARDVSLGKISDRSGYRARDLSVRREGERHVAVIVTRRLAPAPAMADSPLRAGEGYWTPILTPRTLPSANVPSWWATPCSISTGISTSRS